MAVAFVLCDEEYGIGFRPGSDLTAMVNELLEKYRADGSSGAGRQTPSFGMVIRALNSGFLTTLELFALTLAGAIPLGMVIALGSMSPRPLQGLVRVVVWVVRGTPLMLQLLILYYLPGLLGSNIWGGGEGGRFGDGRGVRVQLCLLLNLPRRHPLHSVGQQEAGAVLGMTRAQIFFRVTLLQVIAHARDHHPRQGYLAPRIIAPAGDHLGGRPSPSPTDAAALHGRVLSDLQRADAARPAREKSWIISGLGDTMATLAVRDLTKSFGRGSRCCAASASRSSRARRSP